MVQGKHKVKYYILGGNGFVGKNIYLSLISNKCDAEILKKDDFDLTNEENYSKFNFSNSSIIDCISKIDGDKDIVFQTNFYGLQKFINYLNTKCTNYKYIYFSTFSTQLSKEIELNPYIHSKMLAEEFIEKNIKDYKIIRLIFPFGKGENKNRLLSKLIHKIKNDEKIVINNTYLNLTPIALLRDNFLQLLSDKEKDINFSDGKVYSLKHIVDNLFRLLGKEPNYEYKDNTTINLYSKKISEEELPVSLLKELINE